MTTTIVLDFLSVHLHLNNWSCRGRDHMVVEFTTTYAIGAYHQ
jgi:hypothetical protein